MSNWKTCLIRIASLGTDDLKPYDQRLGVTKAVNSLAMLILVLNLILGPVFFLATGKSGIIVASLAEAVFLGGLIVLNYYKRRTLANTLFFLVLNVATGYFSATMGQPGEAQLMVVFLVGLSLFLFQKRVQRAIGMSTTVLLLVLMEANFKLKFVPAVRASEMKSDIMRWIAYAVIILLVTLLFVMYARHNRRLLVHLQKYYDEEVTQNLQKTKFIRNAYHEVRNQLWGIFSITRMLTKAKDQDRLQEMTDLNEVIGTLRSGCKNLETVLTNILEYSQYDAGIIPQPIYEPVNLKYLLENLVESVRFAAAERKVQIRMHYPSHVPEYLIIDQIKMIQILTNLTNNAIKFTRQYSCIEISIDSDKDKWAVTVRDQGPGIAKDKMKALFKPFVVERNLANAKGVGLGLHISYQLTKALGGTINAQTHPGQGSAFTVCLPIVDCNHSEVESKNKRRQAVPG